MHRAAKIPDPRWRVTLVFAEHDPRLVEVQRSAELGRTGVTDRILELARTGMLAEEDYRTARLPRPRPGAEVRIVGLCTENVRVRLSIERDKLLSDHLREWEEAHSRPAAARLLRLLELGILAEGAASAGTAPFPPRVSPARAEQPAVNDRAVHPTERASADSNEPSGNDPAAEIHRAVLATSW